MTESARPALVLAANALRSAGRALAPEERRDRLAAAAALLSALAFALLLGWGTWALISTARTALLQLPELQPAYLIVHLLRALLGGTALLLLLGSLTSSVSLLFLSDELPALIPLPISHRRLFLGLFLRSIGAASAPAGLLALPLVAVAALRSPSPAAGAAALGAAFVAIALLAGGAGAALALLLVRVVPPRSARLLAAALSAAGLATALVGIRGARPERLFDPAEALEILRRLGTAPPAPPREPVAWAAAAAAGALAGSGSALLACAALAAGSLLVVVAAAALLAPLHLATWRRSIESAEPTARESAPPRARTLTTELLAAEARTFLRDASTPAQVGSLAAVFLLDLLNLRLLPAHDASARDLVGGLQSALGLFLVSALSLRFAYPALSTDGRAALLLRSFPLSPRRHLAARFAVRAAPALAATLLLALAAAAALSQEGEALVASLATACVGAIAIPALHLGLGALAPRYGAPNAISAALGPGGLFALAASTLLALLAAPVVSAELRALLSVVSGLRLEGGPLLAAWSALSLAAGIAALLAGARSLERRDVSLAA